ncbi:MAG: 50S ribosomal protein L25 [Patescibacteria group bacterium]
MLFLPSQKREKEEKLHMLRKQGWIPAVFYGPKVSATSLKVNEKEFDKVYQKAGESSLITLKLQGEDSLALIRTIQREPLRGKVIHVDFYQPPLDREVEVTLPLLFEGEAPAVKNLGGTLIKNLQEVEVKALPQNLPHEIKVDIGKLATFEDKILVKDLTKSAQVEILRDQEDIVAQVVPLEDVQKELEKPIEEKVEEVEKVEKKEEKEEEEKTETPTI